MLPLLEPSLSVLLLRVACKLCITKPAHRRLLGCVPVLRGVANINPWIINRWMAAMFDLCGSSICVVRSAMEDLQWKICNPFWVQSCDDMSRVYVGNLDPRVTERDLEDEFRIYGVLRSVWVARRPPGYAFIEFDDRRDALDAIRALDGKNGWRVELSHNSTGSGGRGGRGGHGSGEDLKCYECGEPGHFARECRLRIGSRGFRSGRRRSPSPWRRRSPSYGYRTYSPRGRRSPYRRSITPRRGRSYSRSPPYYRSRHDSPYIDGISPGRGRKLSRSPPYRRSYRESPYANGD